MGMNEVISMKYGWKYYCLDENHASGTLSSRFFGCQNQYQLQNLKILSTLEGHINLHGQNFWNLNLFYLKRQGYIDITRTKINLWSHHLHT